MEKMRQRFQDLLKRLGHPEDRLGLFEKIARMYGLPRRHYHTFEGHIAHCIEELHSVRPLVTDFDAAELALFLHDIIMNFGRSDNEERSAKYAYEICNRLGLPLDTFGDVVYWFIMATKINAVLEDGDLKIIRDIDYSILGQDEKTFAEYESNIREEYKMFLNEEYRKGRSDFLKGVLARPSIFLTDHFRKKYEAQARKNIEALIKKLA